MATSSARLKQAARFSGPSSSDPRLISRLTSRRLTPSFYFQVLTEDVWLRIRLQHCRGGALIGRAHQRGIGIEHSPKADHVSGADQFERGSEIARRLFFVFVDGCLHMPDQVAPGQKAVLACDHDARVGKCELSADELGEAGNVVAHPSYSVGVPGAHVRDKLMGALLVGGDRRATDAADLRLGRARFNPTSEVRPVAKAMFESDDVLRVGQSERWSSTDRFFDPLLAIGVARLNTALEFARAGAIPSKVEPLG